jgi:hypothetical protein
MNYKFLTIFFSVLLLFQATLLFSQSADQISMLEQQLRTAQLQQDSLAVSINTMMAQTDSLSKRVLALRQKNSLNIAERGQLDNLLKKSQSLSARQEKAVLAHTHISQKINDIKTELTGQYKLREAQLVKSLPNSPKPNSTIANELAEIRTRKSELLEQAKVNVSNVTFDLHIDSNDMPGDIEAKAILLRDREDTFRKKAQELEKRHKAVKDETNLRMRMAEMIDDVRLFDSRDEAISSSNISTQLATDEGNRYSDDKSEGWFNPEDMGGISNSVNVSQANELLSFDFQSIPKYDTQDYLNDLEEHKKGLLLEADSLSQIADEFEKQANKLRNSFKKSPK